MSGWKTSLRHFFFKLLGFWVFWTNQCYFREKLILRNLVVFFLGNLEIVSLSNKNLLVIFIFNQWVKSVCIWSFSGPYFPYFPFIQPESGKIWTRGLQTYTFYFKIFWSKIDLLRVPIMEEAFRYIHRSVYDFMLLHNKFCWKHYYHERNMFVKLWYKFWIHYRALRD